MKPPRDWKRPPQNIAKPPTQFLVDNAHFIIRTAVRVVAETFNLPIKEAIQLRKKAKKYLGVTGLTTISVKITGIPKFVRKPNKEPKVIKARVIKPKLIKLKEPKIVYTKAPILKKKGIYTNYEVIDLRISKKVAKSR